MLMENRMRGNAHVRLGGGQRKRSGPKDRRRASGLPNQVKVRDHGRVVSKALVVAYAVHETGVREVIGLDIGEVESGAFWTRVSTLAQAGRSVRRAPGCL